MKSKEMQFHFKKIKEQRDAFYHDSAINFENAWIRPKPEKWSIGETIYHLVLMIRLFRRFSGIYIPVIYPWAYIRRKKPYRTETCDIYQQFQQKNKKAMLAPFLLIPPSGLEEKWTISEIRAILERETNQLISNLDNIEQEIAGQISYPDPIAGYPNLIQCIHLLSIHEQHHFDIVKKYGTLS